MKIVIIGAGISGLSTYLFLKQHVESIPDQHPEIKIYEAYDVSKYISDSHISGSSPRPNGTARVPSEFERATAAPLHEPVFTPEAIGSAIGISRNGLDVLSRLTTSDDGASDNISSDILADMIRGGHPATKWQMKNARGWLLADVSMLPKRLQSNAEEGSSNNRGSGASDESIHDDCRTSCKSSTIDNIMISRQAFWSILLRHVVSKDGPRVIEHKKVLELVIPSAESDDMTTIKFADGSEETADLVIGTDGLRSIVRKAMFQRGQSQSHGITANPRTGFLPWHLSFFSSSSTVQSTDYVTPHYEGLVGVGSFIPSALLSTTGVPLNTMSIVFGPNGFFGYGYITSSTAPTSNTAPGDVAVFWSTFGSPTENPFPLPEQTDNDRRAKPYKFDRAAALKALLSRHRSWKNPTIQAILDHVKSIGGVDGFYPTWTTPELPTWSKNGRVVLVGDAAHALQPSSGQGACQALEDAEALALLLRHYLSGTQRGNVEAKSENEKMAVSRALKKFDELRIPRLKKIYVRSQRMSGMKRDLGWVGEMCMYGAIWVSLLPLFLLSIPVVAYLPTLVLSFPHSLSFSTSHSPAFFLSLPSFFSQFLCPSFFPWASNIEGPLTS